VVFVGTSCADESSEREFAGQERTSEAVGTEQPTAVGSPRPSSPVPIASPMAVEELLSPRPAAKRLLLLVGDEVRLIGEEAKVGPPLLALEDQHVWAAGLSTDESQIALLLSSGVNSTDWSVMILNADGKQRLSVPLVESAATPRPTPDVVITGSGGIAWSSDSKRLAVSIPTGGIVQIDEKGVIEQLANAETAPRPGALAWSPNGDVLAFVNQPKARFGAGVYAAATNARPIDPVEVLPPDPTGNRNAREIAWLGDAQNLAVVIERHESGNPQGDLFLVPVSGAMPRLAWASPAGATMQGVDAFAVSGDDRVIALVTIQQSETGRAISSVWLKQIDGAAIGRIDLPEALAATSIAWTPAGIVVSGTKAQFAESDQQSVTLAYLIKTDESVVEVFSNAPPPNTPVASPVASPVGTPNLKPD
jgi:hypothetical protein